ncbi:hypothetical protein QL285_015408 [Trifolium repens]|nr:hypothetical protein QL285_015408 [Trifolium repens]
MHELVIVLLPYELWKRSFDHELSNVAKPILVHMNGSPLVPGASQAIRGYRESVSILSKRMSNYDFTTRVLFIEPLV